MLDKKRGLKLITCQTKKRVNSSRIKEISFKEQNLMKRKRQNNREKEHALFWKDQ